VTDPVLFLVPARGGSRRVPGKNLRRVAGIPLVGQAIRTARVAAMGLPDGPHRVVCSTDDEAIGATARTWGGEVPFARPGELAGDDATSVDVALHALSWFEAQGRRFRALALVQPTSPLTEPADLRAAVERFDRSAGRGVVSVTVAHPAGWHVGARPDDDDAIESTGGAGAELLLTGAFYVVDPATLRQAGRFVEPGRTIGLPVAPERSVDIDRETDFVVAEAAAAARPIRPLTLAGRTLGAGATFVIAEIGVNHDGDPGLAHRLIDAAADAGADAVKFQTFDPVALAAAGAPTAAYQRAAGEAFADQREMLARLALPVEVWPALQAHASERGVVFLSSPFDEASAELLDRLDVAAFKVGSGELTNLPFIRRLARRGRPLLVSTGMAEMVEVAAAVDAVAAAGDPPLALFHCVSSYPADPSTANLNAIRTLRSAFGVPTGWSDHSLGIELPIAATAIGASLVEKHLTLDREGSGPDHRASLEPDAFRAMVAGIRMVEAGLGSGEKTPAAAERAIAAVARRSLHWRRSLEAGTLVSDDDLAALRPGTGLSPALWDDVVGRRTTRAVVTGQPVAPDDVVARDDVESRA
jgi:N-acetylneuraminate synthase/N,N'-diacetyllegionaminate synthase